MQLTAASSAGADAKARLAAAEAEAAGAKRQLCQEQGELEATRQQLEASEAKVRQGWAIQAGLGRLGLRGLPRLRNCCTLPMYW